MDIPLAPSTLPNTLLRRLLSEPRRPRQVRESPHARRYIVGTVCIGAFMGQLDASIVTVALPHIGLALHAGTGAARWVLLAYLLVLLGALAGVGRLADRFGRKLLYTYGFAVFTLGSVLCGLAPTLGWLIAARVLQGVGAAMLQANSVAIIREALPSGAALTRGIGVQGAAQALGLALGPALGGLLLALGGWRLIFLLNLPVGIAGTVLGRLLLPRTARDDAAPSAGTRSGGARALLRTPAIASGLGSGLIAYLIMFGTLLVIPYYLAATHLDPALAGLQLATLPIALGILAPLAGRAAPRFGERRLAIGGLLLAGLGLLELALRHGDAGRLLGLALAGGGLGIFIPVNNASVMGAAPRSRAGLLGGILNTTRGLGAALGVALAGLLYSTAAGPPPAAGHPDGSARGLPSVAAGHGLTVTLLTLGGLALATAALLRRPRLSPASAALPGWAQSDPRCGEPRRP
jgi:MFS family permease